MTALSNPDSEFPDAVQLLTNAVQYLAMAHLVTETKNYRNAPLAYNRPILNTLAIGIELFLKASHLRSGSTIDAVANKYRHNLWKLWKDCPEPEVIAMVMDAAEQTHAHAVLSGLAEPTNFLPEEFCKALRNLSKLHTVGGSLLRYLAPPDTLATRPGWLVQTFYKVADGSLRRPPFGL
jgi:hypothetical protein